MGYRFLPETKTQRKRRWPTIWSCGCLQCSSAWSWPIHRSTDHEQFLTARSYSGRSVSVDFNVLSSQQQHSHDIPTHRHSDSRQQQSVPEVDGKPVRNISTHVTWMHICMHTQNHHYCYNLFNGLFSRTTWVSRYQKGNTSMDLNEARNNAHTEG